jgi:cytochrome b6
MIKKRFSNLYLWLDSRFNLSPIIEFMQHKEVPVHRQSIWYYMGGVTLFLFLIQVFTGILLLFYYQPGVNSAYESVGFIMTKVSFGWLFRSIHSWSANLMVFFIFVHMFSTFFTRAFHRPRELTWVTGFLLLCLALFFGFSGYLLPWNELAFFATKVGTDIAAAVPIVGEAIKVILRGGDDVTGATLLRFYAFHVAMLPALFTVLITLHLLFVQRQGMHEPEYIERLPQEKKKTIAFFPNFILRDVLLWLIVLNILLFLAVFFPWELGVKADPFVPAPEGIRPEWYFMFMFQTLKFLPGHIFFIEGEVFGVLFFVLLAITWLLVPFWEKYTKPEKSFVPMIIIGSVAIIVILVMTVLGYIL